MTDAAASPAAVEVVPPRDGSGQGFGFAAYALVFGVCHAWALRWVCDDAFISFRYADHLANGLGLVFNAGERVEGYTNFLWVMLLAAGIPAGLDPVALSQCLGIACYAATIGVLMLAAWRTRTLPLAAVGFACHEHAAVFASCGLETSIFTLLATTGLVVLLGASTVLRYALAGTALILATMSRPDGALLYASAAIVVAIDTVRGRSVRPLFGYSIPFVVLYVPYFVWKLGYYGSPFPNTFYAKSASDPYVGQGLYYVGLYLSCYWHLVPGLLLPIWFCLRNRPWIDPVAAARPSAPGIARGSRVAVAALHGRRAPVLVAVFTVPYLVYVVWVGGDFMFGRFCVPVTPAMLLGLQLVCGPARRGWCLVVAVLAASFLSLYRVDTAARIRPGNPRNVVEEREHYPRWYVDSYRILGARLHEIFANGELRVVIGGGQAMLAWFGRFPVAIEINGLTDAYIARRELPRRGRVGHEKRLPLDDLYLTKQRRVHLIVGAYQQVGVPGDRIAELRRFEFDVENVPFDGKPISGPAQATLLTYDPTLMEPLRGRPGVRFTPFPDWLDGYLARMPALGRERVGLDLPAFDRFYFDGNPDPARRGRIEAFLAGR